jgi:hypothetical protein
MIVLNALLHLIYFVALVIVVIVGCLSIGRSVEVAVERFRARRELHRLKAAKEQASHECSTSVERTRDWSWPPKWKQPPAEYVAPMAKTRVGIGGRS